MPQHAGFVQWCPSCEWGLQPAKPAKPKGRLDRITDRLNEPLSRRLFEEVLDGALERPTSIRLLTLAAAALVHLLTVALFAGGLLLFVIDTALGTGIQYAAAVVCILLGLATQPFPLNPFKRRKEKKRTGNELDRQAAPALFACLDQVAAKVGTTAPEVVSIGPEFNAAYGRNRRGQRTVFIGLSLWYTLTWSERVGILGHEMAHRVNGDLRRGRFVGSALVTLHRWAWLLQPDSGAAAPTRRMRAGNRQGSLAILGELLLPLILIPLTAIVLAFAGALRLFANRQGQRSEYLADRLASEVGGSAATASAFEKLNLWPAVRFHVTRGVKFKQSADIWADLEAFAGSVPDSEMERLHRLSVRELDRIDSTHPPTYMRAEVIRKRAPVEAAVVLDADARRKITEELRAPAAQTSRGLDATFGV